MTLGKEIFDYGGNNERHSTEGGGGGGEEENRMKIAEAYKCWKGQECKETDNNED